jgi:superfamily II helicase
VTSLPTKRLTVPDLTLREQKILHYHVSKHKNDTLPVMITSCMNTIEWSDLPHTILQAKKTLDTLEAHGLIVRNGDESRPTDKGIQVMSKFLAMPHWPRNSFAKPAKKKTTTRRKKSTTRSK